MDVVVVVFRFAFRAVADSPVTVQVNGRLEVENGPLRRAPHELCKRPGGSFLGEATYQVRVPSVIYFQFTCTHSGQVPFRGEWLRYEVTSALTDPILISDCEQVDHPGTVTLRFKLNYETYFGQNVFIVGSIPELGVWNMNGGERMTHSGWTASSWNGLFSDGRFNWQYDLVLPKTPSALGYKYVVKCEGSPLRIEAGAARYFEFDVADGPANYEFNDIWRLKEVVQNMVVKRFFDESFVRVYPLEYPPIGLPDPRQVRCMFVAFSAIVARARCLHVVGSIDPLGKWNPRKGLALQTGADLQAWTYADIDRQSLPFEYKYVAYGGNNLIVWEPNENRRATVSKWADPSIPSTVVVDAWHLRFSGVAFHGAGVLVNLNTITEGGAFFEFSSLIRLARWARKIGFAAIHFVGLFDTTAMTPEFRDLVVSGFAINPFYLDLSSWGFSTRATDRVSILREKLAFLSANWRRSPPLPELPAFFRDCHLWLGSYGQFCHMKNESLSYEFVNYVQCLCYSQLRAAVMAAKTEKVSIGIDLPFALSKDCAEMIYDSAMFMTDFHLGIPPSPTNPVGVVLDAYPYNLKSAASWFSRRVEFLGEIFDLIRLENTLNFFRQWIVPISTSVRAVFGRFDPSVSISFAELETWGLWDIERYTQPYIRPPLLQDIFGMDARQIEAIFFDRRDGALLFKPEFENERKLVDAKLSAKDDKWRQGNLENLFRLMGEVLLMKAGEDEYHPRLQLSLAPIPPSGEVLEPSYSFKQLPPFHQSPFRKIHNEFVHNKQKSLWASNGRQHLRGLGEQTGALVLSDATGSDGEIVDEVLQSLGILPFRAHLEGRTATNSFDDIRDYPYFSLAAPTKDLSKSLRMLWKLPGNKIKHFWEDELYETGPAPPDYDDQAALAMMKLHCWSGSMWVMFPLDSLVGSARHFAADGTSIDLELVRGDGESNALISSVLTNSKRIWNSDSL